MTTKIRDWVLALGFDDSEVSKGVKNVEKILGKLEKTNQKIDKAKKASTKSQASLEISQQKRSTAAVMSNDKKVSRARQQADAAQSSRDKRASAERINRARKEGALGLKRTRAGFRAEDVVATAGKGQRAIAESLGRKGTTAVQRSQLTKQDSLLRQAAQSARNLKAELSKASSAGEFQALNRKLQLLNRTTSTLVSGITRTTAAMRSQSFAAKGLSDSIRNLARGYISVFAAIEGGRALFQTASGFDSLRASLLAASGSAEKAAEDFEFIKNTALRLGVELKVLADGWRQIGSAMRFSGIEAEKGRAQFLQMIRITKSFGLSAADTSLVLLAFQQMISKGVVSSEELRRQLGERLPGAVNVAAQALKVTTLELSNLLRAGKVVTADFMPKFLDVFEKGIVESGAFAAGLLTISSATQRLSAVLQIATEEATRRGAKGGIVQFFESVSTLVDTLTPMFVLLGKVTGSALSIIALGVDLLIVPIRALGVVFENLNKIMDEAFDVNKKSEDIRFLAKIMRDFGVVIGFASGALLVMIGVIDQFLIDAGMSDGSFGWLIDALSVLLGVGLVGGIVKLLRPLGKLGVLFKGVTGKAFKFMEAMFGMSKIAGKLGPLLASVFSISPHGRAILAGAAVLGGGALLAKGLRGGDTPTTKSSVGVTTLTDNSQTTIEITVTGGADSADEVAVSVMDIIQEQFKGANALFAI